MNKVEVHKRIFGTDYEPGTCPYCKRRFDPLKDFRDQMSIREYWVSGLCQQCQDELFGTNGKQPPPVPGLERVVLAPKTLH